MAYLVPTHRDIANRIFVNVLGREVPLTDFLPVGVTRILFEEGIVSGFAGLHRELGLAQNSWYLDEDGARGAELDRRLAEFGLIRPGPQAATGEVTFAANGAGATVTHGSVLTTTPDDPDIPTRRYLVAPNPSRTDQNWIVPADGSLQVRVVAQDAGEVGNTAPYTITGTEGPIAGVVSVTNDRAIINGRNRATDDEALQYLRSWFASLGGATRGGIIHRVLTWVDPTTGTTPVHSVALEEWDGINVLEGNVALRIWVEENGTAGPQLVESIQALIDGADTQGDPGLRGAGLPALVVPARPFTVDVTVTIDIERNVAAKETQDEVRTTIERFIARVPVSGKQITGEVQGKLIFAQLFRAVMNVRGVLRAVFQSDKDIVLQPGQKVMPGVVNVIPGRVA